MKTTILPIITILCTMLLSLGVQAQNEIHFSYDNSGNMISRTIYFPSSPTIATPGDDEDGSLGDDTTTEEAGTEETTETKGEEKFFEGKVGLHDIRIYPNPTSGILVVEIPGYRHNTSNRIDIVDMQGSLKQRISPVSSSNTVDISPYPAATYILLIHVGGESTQWKIIKQ